MRDGSDAIADWPVLNALVNTSAGATWGLGAARDPAWGQDPLALSVYSPLNFCEFPI